MIGTRHNVQMSTKPHALFADTMDRRAERCNRNAVINAGVAETRKALCKHCACYLYDMLCYSC